MNRRLMAMILPPLLALIAAGWYTEHRARNVARDVAAFCSQIDAGTPVADFIQRALAADFEVHDFGAESPTVIASRTVYTLHEEIFECSAVRDSAGLVRSASYGHRLADG